MYQTRIATIALTGLVCLGLSCGPKGAGDQALTTDIQAKLYASDATRAANVKVAVNNGVVTLSGDVPSSDVELQALKIANATTGVKSVTDQMKVQSAAATPPPAPVDNMTPSPAPAKATDAPPKRNEPAAASAQTPAPVATQPPPADTPAPISNPTPFAEDSAPPAPVRPKIRRVTIPAGERIAVRMIDGIDTGRNTAGQTFRASLDSPLVANGRVIVPAGAPVTVLLETSKGAGRIKGQSELEVRATNLTYKGETIPINTSIYSAQGGARGKQTAVRTGIGAAAGAVIGALAGGGKGAAIGSLAGGGAGAGYQLATHGKQVKIPSETQLTFSLEAPLTLIR
jgi:hypothetical protein